MSPKDCINAVYIDVSFLQKMDNRLEKRRTCYHDSDEEEDSVRLGGRHVHGRGGDR